MHIALARLPLAPASFSVCLVVAVLAFFSGCTNQPAGSDPSAAGDNNVETALPSDEELAGRIDEVVAFTAQRKLNPAVNNAWHIVHGILAFGDDLKLEVEGETRPALEYLLNGGYTDGWDFAPGEKGLDSLLEPGSKAGQGHDDQWLGYMSQCGVPLERTIQVRGETFTIADLVTEAQWDVREGMEATWTLMGLGTLLPIDATWPARDGSQWSLERIAGMEAAHPVGEGACGGAHRLYAMAVAVRRYEQQGGALTGGWQSAHQRVNQGIEAARDYQQPDGGFSVEFFRRSATSPDIARRISTTGHVLEFLMASLDDEQVREPWVKRAAVFLCDQLEMTREMPLECGGLYHAAHSLKLFRQRCYGPGEVAQAEVPQTSETVEESSTDADNAPPAPGE